MYKIKVTVDANGYVTNYATIGGLTGDVEVQVSDFDALNFDCYKLVNGELVWDDKKYQTKINPVPIVPQTSDIEVLKQRTEDLEILLTDILMGGF